MRVALLYPARRPVDPSNWSGTPQGLCTGLAARGVEVCPVGTTGATGWGALMRLTQSAPLLGPRSATSVTARTQVMRAALRAVGPVDATIAMGSELYELARVRTAAPTASYDDATLLQQWRNRDSDIRNSGASENAVRAWSRVQAASARAADAVCVSTAWAGSSFVTDYEVAADRVAVVGMGHRSRSGAPERAKEWEHPRFLFVGIDWRRKNGDAVIRAFRAVRQTRPDAILDVVGSHPPMAEPGVTGHGLLARDDPDAQRRLDELFARATAFVLPSRYDPSPIAYLEAASAGLPVIATTEGGAGALLGPAALEVHPDDHDRLVAAMTTLCDGGQARRMGARGAEVAAESTWTHVAGRILRACGH